jgi:hypothetical protein
MAYQIKTLNTIMHFVYLETDQARWWVEQSGVECDIVDVDQWTTTPQQQRIAIVEVLNFDEDTQSRVEFAVNHAGLAVLFMQELVTDEWCKLYDRHNVVMFVGAVLNYKLDHARVYFCPYFFWSTVDFYRTVTNILTRLDNSQATHGFDILLGRKKQYRDQIFNTVDHNTNLVRYFPSDQDLDIRQYSNNEFAWPRDVVSIPAEPVNFTVQEVVVNGTIVSLSQIVPVDIYNQTHYTLIPETLVDNQWSFFTEKLIKPILARRLFVVASGQHYLANLRKLGFQTFDTVVDEGYDAEADTTRRISMVCQEINKLGALDADVVKSNVAGITDHNYQVLMHTDWQANMIDQLGAEISSYIELY